jgi:hypothetical protein
MSKQTVQAWGEKKMRITKGLDFPRQTTKTSPGHRGNRKPHFRGPKKKPVFQVWLRLGRVPRKEGWTGRIEGRKTGRTWKGTESEMPFLSMKSSSLQRALRSTKPRHTYFSLPVKAGVQLWEQQTWVMNVIAVAAWGLGQK